MVTHNSHKRHEVAQLYMQGKSASVIHKELKEQGCMVPPRTIQRWCRQIRKDGNADRMLEGPQYKTSGNPKKGRRGARPLSEHDRMRLRRLAEKLPEVPYRELSTKLPRDLKASKSTLQREAAVYGLVSFHMTKKPRLSHKNIQKRIALAKATQKDSFNWGQVVFIDEFTVGPDGSINTHNHRYRAFEKKQVPSIPTSKSSIAETRMLILTPKGGIPLIPCPTNPTAPQMQAVLETAIPLINAKMGEEYCLVHDNCPGLLICVDVVFDSVRCPAGWAADSTQDHIEERVPAFISQHQYPGNSPDFNGAENAIARLKEAIARLKITTRAALCAALDSEWERIGTAEYAQQLLASMPKRMAAVIKAKGGMTKY